MKLSWKDLNVSASIKSGAGNATGFVIRFNDQYFLITPKHALYDDAKAIFKCESCEISQPAGDIRYDFVTTFQVDLSKCISRVLPQYDILVIKLFDLNPATNKVLRAPGVDYTPAIGHTSGAWNIEQLTLLSNVDVGVDVYIIGYPTSIGLRRSAQFDYNKPLLKRGTVSNVNFKQNTIILDSSVYQGNSGSPVISVERKCIGMIIQSIPYVQKWYNMNDKITNEEYHNSSYSVAISCDAIIEVLNLFGNKSEKLIN